MESNDTEELFYLKIWPFIEANKNAIIGGAIALVAAVLLVIFYNWERTQKEINAGQAFSQLVVSPQPGAAPASQADQYLRIAADYAGTSAAQRAQLQAAADLFTAEKYADAQTQFQKFLDTYAGNPLAGVAALGVAAALDAQGNLSAAADAYRNLLDTYPNSSAAISAQYALAGVYERLGKPLDAVKYYQEVAHTFAGSTLAEQAGQRAMELMATLPTPGTVPAVAAPAPASPSFQLSK